MSPALEFHDLTVSYDRKPVLFGVDAAIPQQSLTGIIGPNGAGKSTLIKAVMGLLPVQGGWTQVFGGPLDKCRQRVAYVPQRSSVDWDFPVNVMDVVLMGRYGRLGLLRRPKAKDRAIAAEALEKVQMSDYAVRQISQLSGGQQQRVFLARALAQEAVEIVGRGGEVVMYGDDGAAAGFDVLEQGDDGTFRGGIHTSEGFIHKIKVRFLRQRSGQKDALLLAA